MSCRCLLLFVALFHLSSAAAATAVADFQHDVSQMVQLRSTAYQFARDNGIIRDKSPRLTRQQGNQVREMGLEYLRLRATLLPRAEAVAELFEGGPHVVLSTAHATGEDMQEALLTEGRDKALQRRWLNPTDAAGRQLLMKIQTGLAAALVLMDSYQIAVEPYANNPSLAYVLTYDVDSKQSLARLQANYHSTDFRSRLRYATRFVDQYMEWKRDNNQPANEDEDYLYALTQSTVWYVTLRGKGDGGLADAMHYLAQRFDARQKNVRARLSHGLSLGFGNMVGLVQTRRGKLYHLPDAEKQALAREIKPLDILLEKTPFRLTDKMIPGHYGHVAVWLGSEEELRALGAWERIAPRYQAQIRAGGRIVEALRSGVTISRLDHFLNIDDLLVLRDTRPLDDGYRRAAILTALEQVGKEYDFNFDVMTHKRIVCSELAYVVFPDVQWPLQKTLGRYTLSPDNVAQLAVSRPAIFEPTVLYNDGIRVQQGRLQRLGTLLGEAMIMTSSTQEAPAGPASGAVHLARQ